VEDYIYHYESTDWGGVVRRKKNKNLHHPRQMGKKKVDSDSEDSFINDDESEDEVLLSLYAALFS
jgi:hypothetical protein